MGSCCSLLLRRRHRASGISTITQELQQIELSIQDLDKLIQQLHLQWKHSLQNLFYYYAAADVLALSILYLWMSSGTASSAYDYHLGTTITRASLFRLVTRPSVISSLLFLLSVIAYLILKSFVDLYFSRSIKNKQTLHQHLLSRQGSMLQDLLLKTDFEQTQNIVANVKSRLQGRGDSATNERNADRAKQIKLGSAEKKMRNSSSSSVRKERTASNRTMQTLPISQSEDRTKQIVAESHSIESVRDRSSTLHANDAHVAVPAMQAKRSVLDKLVDFVLKDGPNNKLALICTHCHTHNGLLRGEDAASLSWFKCLACGLLNDSEHRMRSIAATGSSSSSATSLVVKNDEQR